MHSLTFCISTYNNLPYLKLAIESVRKYSYFKDAPFIVHAENCTDGTNEWLIENKVKYDLTTIIEPNNEIVRGIGGGMNICAENVKTEYIMFLHSDFIVSQDWDKACYDILQRESDPTMAFSFRIQPDIFNQGRAPHPGTLVVPLDAFGSEVTDFNNEIFQEYANGFKQLNNIEIPKPEGVSGLIKKSLWDSVGGNDPLFSPTSWDDMDLFLRMHMAGIKFILTTKSVVWHFAARGSHRLQENEGRSSDRQLKAQADNFSKWMEKWGGPPDFNEFGTIIGIKR
jgi:GT2 family glycosyltransferase